MLKNILLASTLVCLQQNSFSLNSVAELLDNTDWRGTSCSSYGDGLFQGTYNYVFKENNRVESYLEYYDDYHCTKPASRTDAQIIGKYEVKSFTKDSQGYSISLAVKMTHLREIVTFNIKLNDKNMKLCWDNRWCSNLIKR